MVIALALKTLGNRYIPFVGLTGQITHTHLVIHLESHTIPHFIDVISITFFDATSSLPFGPVSSALPKHLIVYHVECRKMSFSIIIASDYGARSHQALLNVGRCHREKLLNIMIPSQIYTTS
jgi:hypothetical protein